MAQPAYPAQPRQHLVHSGRRGNGNSSNSNDAYAVGHRGMQSIVDPLCVGTLDYEPMPSEWGCCCCCPWELPLPCCYKRKIGAAFVCCERTTETGEKKVVCMLGAGWV